MERGERDPYEVLGVDSHASEEEVRAAFRRKAEIYHPDRYQDRPVDVQQEAARMMVELNDAKSRIQRDRGAEHGPRQRPSTPPPPRGPAPPAAPPASGRPAPAPTDRQPNRGRLWPVPVIVVLVLAIVVFVLATRSPDSESPAPQTEAAIETDPTFDPGATSPTTTSPTTTTTTVTATATATATEGSVADRSIDGRSLPSGLAQAAAAVHDAARRGDYEALRSLMAPEFAFTFGSATDPIAYWQDLEQNGEDPLADLAAALELPPTLDAYGDGENIAAFPYLFAKPPAAYTSQDTPAIEQLGYSQADVQDWTNYGSYIGWRAMFGPDGTWYAFVEGD